MSLGFEPYPTEHDAFQADPTAIYKVLSASVPRVEASKPDELTLELWFRLPFEVAGHTPDVVWVFQDDEECRLLQPVVFPIRTDWQVRFTEPGR